MGSWASVLVGMEQRKIPFIVTALEVRAAISHDSMLHRCLPVVCFLLRLLLISHGWGAFRLSEGVSSASNLIKAETLTASTGNVPAVICFHRNRADAGRTGRCFL